jgi:hypothetical protein
MSLPRPRTESELIELMRSIDVRAPEELQRKVESLIAARAPGAPGRRISVGLLASGRSRLGMRLAGATALSAVVAVALVAGLSGGGSPGPSLNQASSLTLRPATAPAPAESPSNRTQLAAAVDGISFPYWEEHFGWRSTGARSDRLDGRAVTTVFYQDNRGRRIGYAIVAGTPAPPLHGGAVAWRGGVPYRMLSENGVQVVSWLRHGHMCVVSGREVDGATLLRLASWADRSAVAA